MAAAHPGAPAPQAAQRLQALLSPVRAAGRTQLLEHEALAVAALLGISAPHHVVVADADAVPDLQPFAGDRIVIKALSASVAHKTELGGVVVVPRDRSAVTAAIATMQRRLHAHALAGFLLAQWLPHDSEPGGELLLGLRWSREFGPLVTLGLGGVTAERVALAMRPDEGPAIFAPGLADAAAIERQLQQQALGALGTGRLRGRAGRASLQDLVALVQRALEFAAWAVPSPLAELECNPITFVDGRPFALDALVRLGDAAPALPPPRPLSRAAAMLRPARMAVMGVSSRGENPGRIVLRNTLAAGMPPSQLTVIKPGEQTVDGVACMPDLTALPQPVDLLVLAVPAAEVPAIVEQAVATGRAHGIVLLTSGLGEREGSGDAAARLQATLRQSRSSAGGGVVLNGGNCLGLRSAPGCVDTLFIPHRKLPLPTSPPSPLAIVSQSGAFAIARLSRLAWLNPRAVVTAGNQLDLTVADWIEVLAADPEVAAIACYVEGFPLHEGLRCAQLAARLRAEGRLLCCYRAGRTPEGSAASASHTASLAGDWAATRSLLAQAGALVAESIDDFEDLLRLAATLSPRRVDGHGLGVISNAGFECVAIADNLGPLRLAPLQPATRQRLGEVFTEARISGFIDVHHPLDVTPIAGDRAFAAAAAALLEDPDVHAGLIGCVPLTAALATLPAEVDAAGGVAAGLVELWQRTPKPLVVAVDSGALYDAFAAKLEAHGLPVFRAADRAARMLGRYVGWRLQAGGR